MPTTTPNLNLKLYNYNDTTTTFVDYWQSVNLNGDGTTYDYSAFQLIDSAIGTINTTLGTLSPVVANPTLVGTEATLTGLQVGTVKYVISDGLPSTTGATEGQVLSLDSSLNPIWASVSSGGGSIIALTYAELKALRDNSELTPGQIYRITDYDATCTISGRNVFNHHFDILVIATTINKFSEEAGAINSARDTDGYFSRCNLTAWKLWYCFDNNSTRFGWADEPGLVISAYSTRVAIRKTSGDDLSTDYPYAWYNSYYGYIYTDTETPSVNDTAYSSHSGGTSYTISELHVGGTGVIYRMIDEWNNEAPCDFKNISASWQSTKYIFNAGYYDNADATVVPLNFTSVPCVNNIIKGGNSSLTTNYMYGTNSSQAYYRDNYIDFGCSSCHIDEYGGSTVVRGNYIGQNCSNSFIHNSTHTNIGADCSSISVNCGQHNDIKNSSSVTISGYRSYSNRVTKNQIINCSNITIGANNTNAYNENNILINCSNITTIEGCSNNIFKNAKYVNLSNVYTYYNVFDGCNYLTLTGATTPTSASKLQNVVIHAGDYGTSSSDLKNISVATGLGYSTDIYADDSVNELITSNLNDVLATLYDNTATYTTGDVVSYNGRAYECNTDITVAEDWTPAHWTEKTVEELISAGGGGASTPLTYVEDVSTGLTESYSGTSLRNVNNSSQTLSNVSLIEGTSSGINIVNTGLNNNNRLILDSTYWASRQPVLEFKQEASIGLRYKNWKSPIFHLHNNLVALCGSYVGEGGRAGKTYMYYGYPAGELFVQDYAQSVKNTIYSSYNGSDTYEGNPSTGTNINSSYFLASNKFVMTTVTNGYNSVTSTVSSGDIISDTGLINAFTKHLPVTLNDKLWHYQGIDTNVVYYGNVVMSSGNIKLSVLTFDTTTNEITFSTSTLTPDA